MGHGFEIMSVDAGAVYGRIRSRITFMLLLLVAEVAIFILAVAGASDRGGAAAYAGLRCGPGCD